MIKRPQSPRARAVNIWLMAPLLGFVLFVIGFGLMGSRPAQAEASSYINFQARLLNSAGGIVPDGNYNIDFKLYNADSTTGSVGTCSGACLWEETRTNAGGSGVKVVNGYFSVNLGSVTAFSSSINWDQQLYLTMNITTDGTMTGAPASTDWDGEMQDSGHSIKLTSVPYAFATNQLIASGANKGTLSFDTLGQTTDIKLPDPGTTATQYVCYQSDSDCGFLTGSASDYIQNGTSLQTNANFNIQSAAVGSVGGIIAGASGQTADIFQVKANGVSDSLLSVGKTGEAVFKNSDDSAGAFQVQNSSGGALLSADTLNGVIDIGSPGGAVYSDNFDDGNLAGWDGVTSVTVSTDRSVSGAYSAKSVSNNSASYLSKTVPSSPILYVSSQVNVDSTGGALDMIIIKNTTYLYTIYRDVDNSLCLYNGVNGGRFCTSANELP
ncbi:MAG TPA: hypothetical protein VFW90_02670, partial [Candidatus Saccharimonadales bacterium]|nr:hypothetical protein [Candidatus Saccharimonadales bacterium]